jgi:asparagine N-glycosylation enzyme membrane subunit Stt3
VPFAEAGCPRALFLSLAGDDEMNLLMFVPLLMFILISIGLGAIPGVLAKRKHRSRALWWVAGAFGFPIALVSILFFRDLELIRDEQKARSRLKEKIILVVILILWAGMAVSRVQMARQ